MKISKRIFPALITVILFFIPFFWLKPGEMDLGGDTSRLYFYDPISYFFNSVLFIISPSNYGGVNYNYVHIPVIAIFILLKFIFHSPTVLIDISYGLCLSMGFLFCYLTIRELTDNEKKVFPAIVGGLLYVFSPALINNWTHVLLTFNLVFLNPLIFYLLLRYFKTTKIYFLFIIALLTFLFSTNFSFVAAPALFSFYPLSILFLIIYTKLILKRRIIIKHLILAFVLFVGIQVFHLIPLISNMFSKGSDIGSTIFSAEGKLDRGLSYFSAIAPNIKASIHLLGLPQMSSLNDFSKVFLILPFIIFVSFLFNKKKTILLTAVFFVIILFFVTANITNVWLSIYKFLFFLPGFSMFRNFYGQWQYTYIFFYSILFGQALYVLLNRLSLNKLGKVYSYILMFLLVSILVINATPLIRGNITKGDLWQSDKVSAAIKMDPDYEHALLYVRNLPVDARVLTLPLTDTGYQMIGGENGGAYMGPSTISYLAGKKDFAGYDELLDYKELVSQLIAYEKYEELKKFLGFLNVKYIFYNADQLVYGSKFPSFPYEYVRTMFPKDQKSYRQFLDKLHLKEIKNIKNKFFVFELPDEYFSPHITIARKTIYFNKPFMEISVPLSIDSQENRIAVGNNYSSIPKNYPIKFDETLTDIQDRNSFQEFFLNADYSVGFPYAFSAWPTNSLVYPLVVLKENLQLSRIKKVDVYIERAILLADKRIGELERWGREMPVLKNVKSIDVLDKSWQEPAMWEALTNRTKYNYWEIGVLRYKRQVNNLIDKIEKSNNSLYSASANKQKLEKAVMADRERFYTIIERDEKLSGKDKLYLLRLCVGMLDSIESRLQLKLPSPEEASYNLDGLEKGTYEIFIDKKSMGSVDQSKLQIVINNKKFYLKDFQQNNDWYRGQNLIVKDAKDNILTLLSAQSINLISDNQWKSSEENALGENYVSLFIENTNLPSSKGLVNKINDWSPNSNYILSFEYLTHGKSFKIITYDKSLQKDSGFKEIFEDDLRSSEWKSYKVILKSSNDTYLALLQILKSERGLLDTIDTNDTSSKVEIKNFSIIRVPNPKIVLKKVITPFAQNIILPKVTFARINPAKYEVKVENATASYTLVLIDQFNQNWRLIDPTQNKSTMETSLGRLLANIGGRAVKILSKENIDNKNTTLSYFNGDIKEIVGKDIFLNEKTFETWGKKEIADDKHFPANGYSNAWYIEPKDMNGKTEYALIIEMTEQKKIYIALVISLFCVFLTFAFFLRSLLKSK